MIELTKEQSVAKEKIVEWYNDTDPNKNQVFVMSGLAGTGKTTLIKEIIDDLGIMPQTRFVAFTGKAALVLNQKGLPATTIHGLIYRIVDEGEENSMFSSKKSVKQNLKFEKVETLPDTIKWLICDEGSMLNKEMFEDLKSFGLPILIAGDKNQLPPITGNIDIFKNPDVHLSEIVRQESDNPIILLAHNILAEGRIVNKKWGSNIKIHIAEKIKESSLLNASQVLCYRNETRTELNKTMRKLNGKFGDFPVMGDKLICLKNNNRVSIDGVPMINGCIGFAQSNAVMNNSLISGSYSFNLMFCPDFASRGEIILACKEPFEKCSFIDKFNGELNYFDYGYAITVHKSQGSEFDNVLIQDDVPRNIVPEEDVVKWLYTAVTRAKKNLIYYR